MLKQQLKHFYITGLSNLVLPYDLSLIVDHNILTLIWHTFVHLWLLDTPRTPYSPWTNGLREVQNKNLITHIRMFTKHPQGLGTPSTDVRFST